jgi:hypothetical protein
MGSRVVRGAREACSERERETTEPLRDGRDEEPGLGER